MNSLMIDRRKLKTIRNFAKEKDITVQQIYNWIKDEKVKHTTIDGVKFIII